MKWRSLFFIFTCLLMQKLVSTEEQAPDTSITVKKIKSSYEFSCEKGKWEPENENLLRLEYKELYGEYQCSVSENVQKTVTVRFRTCDNCIELDAPALSAIIVGNILATFLIGCAVYSITRQPKGKNFSGNKASDKVNLISNGEGDTYQRLTAGQNSEYSRLERKK